MACSFYRNDNSPIVGVVGVHTNEYKNKKYGKGKETLDFIAEHHSGKLTIGVEVKNTISVLDKKEVDNKLDMCDFLGIKPVFAARLLEPYTTKFIKDKGGFSWIFKTQLYPPSMEALTEKLSKKLQLPAKVETQLPTEPIQLFHNWAKTKQPKLMWRKHRSLASLTLAFVLQAKLGRQLKKFCSL
jgi:hypothetical protein